MTTLIEKRRMQTTEVSSPLSHFQSITLFSVYNEYQSLHSL